MHFEARIGGLLLLGATMLVVAYVPGCASGDRRRGADAEEVVSAVTQRMAADRALQRGRYDEAVKAYAALLGEASNDGATRAALHFKLAQAYWGRSNQVDGSSSGESSSRRSTASNADSSVRSARERSSTFRKLGNERRVAIRRSHVAQHETRQIKPLPR